MGDDNSGNVENKIFNFANNNIITQTRYNSYLNNSNCEFYLYLKNGIGLLTGFFNPSSNFNVSYQNTDIGGTSSWPVILLLDVTDIDTSNFLSQGSFLFKGDTYNNNFEFVCATMNIVNYNDKKYLSIGVHSVGLNTNRSYNFNPSTLLL